MAPFHKLAAFTALTIVLGVGVVLSARQARVAGTRASASAQADVTGDVLRRAGTADDSQPGAWLSYGRTQSETRYSPLTQITTSNAKNSAGTAQLTG